jgi:glycerophosphoryl diester phosphodiesterase
MTQVLLMASIGSVPIHRAAGQTQGPEGAQFARRATPIVIAHRGASGYMPEHTLPAYSTAALLGADYIELDLVSTRDGQLIARHDNVLDLTTNVAELPEYRDRQTEKIVDGRVIRGWFSEDFTLEEIRNLRAIERIPTVRPANTRFDGHYTVPTLKEAIAAIQALQTMLTREIGLYIELKHPTYFDGIGLPMEATLIEGLRDSGYQAAHHPVYLQSFEVENLRRLNGMTDLRLVQLLGDSISRTSRRRLTDVRRHGDSRRPTRDRNLRRRRRPREDAFSNTPQQRGRPGARGCERLCRAGSCRQPRGSPVYVQSGEPVPARRS